MTKATNATATSGRPHDAWPPGLLRVAHAAICRIGRAYLDARVRRASARLLQSMDDRMLKDFGLSRGQIHSAIYGGPDERVRRSKITWE
jgi:uncharacterized protein YjiS (DUF1127 family)